MTRSTNGFTGLIAALAVAIGLGGVASAEPLTWRVALQDDDGDDLFDDDPVDDPAPVAAVADKAAAPAISYGVGLRLRSVIVPAPLVELFVERATPGDAHPGFGLQFVRRNRNFEIVLGLGYEGLAMEDGYWIDKNEMIPQNDPDLVEFEDFGWLGIDAMFVWHAPLHDKVAFRYGGGFGLGIIRGAVYRTDARCSTSDVASCSPIPGAAREKEDSIPPVFPIINVLAGLQVKPIEKLSINIEGGIRPIPFFGLSADYFF